MKALSAGGHYDDRRSSSQGVCEYYLPWLKCDRCEQDWRALGVMRSSPSPWIETEVWYPTFIVAKEADKAKFTRENSVNLCELESMRKLIAGKGIEKAKLPPGSGVGPVRAKLSKRATDFVWCSFKLLASRHAIEVLQDAGIHLLHGPVVEPRTGAKTDYVAVQLDPVALYSQQTLAEMTLVFCSTCGNCWMQNTRAKLSGPRQYVRERVPEEQGLVKTFEGYETIATERFMEAVRREKLTGMVFEESGVYV